MIEKVNSKHLNKVVNRIACAALHEKDLPKANVQVNIYAFSKVQLIGCVVEILCVTGDEFVIGKPHREIATTAKSFTSLTGGFEKFVEQEINIL